MELVSREQESLIAGRHSVRLNPIVTVPPLPLLPLLESTNSKFVSSSMQQLFQHLNFYSQKELGIYSVGPWHIIVGQMRGRGLSNCLHAQSRAIHHEWKR